VLSLIPGLENARFLRYGQIHRNTYINSPALLNATLQMKAHPQVLLRGNLRSGRLCRIHRHRSVGGNQCCRAGSRRRAVAAPRETALGSLIHYITRAESKHFQPANITFDLLPALATRVRDRKERHRQQCELALREFTSGKVVAAGKLQSLGVARDSDPKKAEQVPVVFSEDSL